MWFFYYCLIAIIYSPTWWQLFHSYSSELLGLNSHQSCLTWPYGFSNISKVGWIICLYFMGYAERKMFEFTLIIYNLAFRKSYTFCIMSTVRCCHNIVQYDIILYTALQWLRQNITEFQFIKKRKTSHTLSSRAGYAIMLHILSDNLYLEYRCF